MQYWVTDYLWNRIFVYELFLNFVECSLCGIDNWTANSYAKLYFSSPCVTIFKNLPSMNFIFPFLTCSENKRFLNWWSIDHCEVRTIVSRYVCLMFSISDQYTWIVFRQVFSCIFVLCANWIEKVCGYVCKQTSVDIFSGARLSV